MKAGQISREKGDKVYGVCNVIANSRSYPDVMDAVGSHPLHCRLSLERHKACTKGDST